jgi:hypothetical protein
MKNSNEINTDIKRKNKNIFIEKLIFFGLLKNILIKSGIRVIYERRKICKNLCY